MEKNFSLVTLDDASNILEEIREAYKDVPFTNTKFQIENFVIGAQITPARAWRSIGLQISSIIQSITSSLIDRERLQIDIEELEELLSDPSINKFEKRRKELLLKVKMNQLPEFEKSFNDSVRELNIYYQHFKQLPKYTREEFEAEERVYYEQSLQRQVLGLVGAKESLMNLMHDTKTIENFKQKYSLLTDDQRDSLLHLAITSLASPVNISFEDKNDTTNLLY